MALVLTVPVLAEPWRQYESPAEAGWSVELLEQARNVAEEVGSASVMVIENGTVVAAWGEVDRSFPIYSMRKGIYNALYGVAIRKGLVDLDSSLAELEIDDLGGLSDIERSATVADLLASRSGIYHESAYEPSSMKRSRPERGSHKPGEHWFYNNWDFNALLAILEKSTDQDAYAMFRDTVAKPLGMEDLSNSTAFSFLEPSTSEHPALIFRMSARDLARLGQLYLQNGKWNDRQIIPSAWIEKSWTPHTVFPTDSPWGAGNGFGYLWWIYPDHPDDSVAQDVYVTRGSDGQVLAVVPYRNLVFVHQTDTENGRESGFGDAMRVLAMVHQARSVDRSTPDGDNPETVALHPQPFENPLAPPVRRTAMDWTQELIESFTGSWNAGGRIPIEVHEYEGRLFALPRGVPLAEAELFAETPDRLFSPVLDLLLDVERDEAGMATTLRGRVNGMQMEISRVEVDRKTDAKH